MLWCFCWAWRPPAVAVTPTPPPVYARPARYAAPLFLRRTIRHGEESRHQADRIDDHDQRHQSRDEVSERHPGGHLLFRVGGE